MDLLIIVDNEDMDIFFDAPPRCYGNAPHARTTKVINMDPVEVHLHHTDPVQGLYHVYQSGKSFTTVEHTPHIFWQ